MGLNSLNEKIYDLEEKFNIFNVSKEPLVRELKTFLFKYKNNFYISMPLELSIFNQSNNWLFQNEFKNQDEILEKVINNIIIDSILFRTVCDLQKSDVNNNKINRSFLLIMAWLYLLGVKNTFFVPTKLDICITCFKKLTSNNMSGWVCEACDGKNLYKTFLNKKEANIQDLKLSLKGLITKNESINIAKSHQLINKISKSFAQRIKSKKYSLNNYDFRLSQSGLSPDEVHIENMLREKKDPLAYAKKKKYTGEQLKRFTQKCKNAKYRINREEQSKVLDKVTINSVGEYELKFPMK